MVSDNGQNVATVALMDFELHIASVRTGAERRCSRVHRPDQVRHIRAPSEHSRAA
jgi:hypothetical protein